MFLFCNKAEKQHIEVADSYFTKTDDYITFIYRGSIHDFYWKEATHEILDVVHPHYNVKQLGNICLIY